MARMSRVSHVCARSSRDAERAYATRSARGDKETCGALGRRRDRQCRRANIDCEVPAENQAGTPTAQSCAAGSHSVSMPRTAGVLSTSAHTAPHPAPTAFMLQR